MEVAPEDKCENVRREICLTLERMGIMPESSHHEEGPGQNEIDFRYSDALSAADNAVTFCTVVKTIAARNGLFADFSPKPLQENPGSGYTLHVVLTAEGVWVERSDCPTQDCVHTGHISRSGQSIVCLPARVVIRLEGGTDSGVDAVIG